MSSLNEETFDDSPCSFRNHERLAAIEEDSYSEIKMNVDTYTFENNKIKYNK